MNLNKNYDNLEQSYLFSTIAKKVNEYIGNVPCWTCEKCGKKNAEYVGSCGCGYSVRKTISPKQNDSNKVKISKALLEKK